MKKFTLWIKTVIILISFIAFGKLFSDIFGTESIVSEFINSKIVYTPYNITGIVMVCLAPFGIWFGKRGGRKLFKIISFMLLTSSIFSFIPLTFLPEKKDFLNISSELLRSAFIIIGVLISIVTIFLILKSLKHKEVVRKQVICLKEVKKSNYTTTHESLSPENKNTRYDTKNNISTLNRDLEKVEDSNSNIVYSKHEKLISMGLCPKCGGNLVSRQNRNDGSWFKGCNCWPSCTFTISYYKYKRLQDI